MNLVGEESITDINANVRRAKILNTNYERLKRELLNDAFWKCARKRAALTPVVTPPDFGYSYAYDLPVDYIRLYEIYENNNPDYIVEGNQLLYTDAELKLIYIADIDETLMDTDFTAVLIHKLADYLCYNHIQSNDT
jgi:hypothetical protein